MPIPACNSKGLLPFGIHRFDEMADRFGRFVGSDRRPVLCSHLRQVVGEMRRSSLFSAIVIDGSFVTTKPSPNDIDIVLVLRAGHDWGAELNADDYALLSRQRRYRHLGFDILIAEDGSPLYEKYVRFYSQTREGPVGSKGILRIDL